MKKTVNKATGKGRIGSSFESFLHDEGLRDKAYTHAVKTVLAAQLREQMQRQKVTAVELAKRMATSRSQLDRVLGGQEGLTFDTAVRAANALGCKLEVHVRPARRAARRRSAEKVA